MPHALKLKSSAPLATIDAAIHSLRGERVILNSPQAVQRSVFVVRAFIKMRSAFTDTRELTRKLAELETELKARLDLHERAIVAVLQRVMALFDPPPPPTETPRPAMGFHASLKPALPKNP